MDIFITTNFGYQKVNTEHILCIEACANNACMLHCAHSTVKTNVNLKHFEALNRLYFFKVDRNWIVNLLHVDSHISEECECIQLDGRIKIPIRDNRRNSLNLALDRIRPVSF